MSTTPLSRLLDEGAIIRLTKKMARNNNYDQILTARYFLALPSIRMRYKNIRCFDHKKLNYIFYLKILII